MQLARPVSAARPPQFGRGPVRQLEQAHPAAKSVSDDVKLFATTFAAGFVFMTVLLA
jgi:hypothetical protein